MTKEEFIKIVEKILANPEILHIDIIERTYSKMGKNQAEIDQLYTDFKSIRNSYEEQGFHGLKAIYDYLTAPKDEIVVTNTENGVTEINIKDGYPKFDPTGKSDMPNAPATFIPVYGENDTKPEINVAPIAPVPTTTDQRDVNFPNTEGGLISNGQEDGLPPQNGSNPPQFGGF